MKQWKKQIEIHTPIEQVWMLFDGSLDHMQQIMPQVIENRPIKVTPEVVGSVYRQKYKEGKRIEEYDVTTLAYLSEPEEKKLKVSFTLANMFEITALYELSKRSDTETLFQYTVTNRPLKWFVTFFLWFASDKIVVTFLERVKHVAESRKYI
ncbi:SRPBCC family protein [Bacillus thuringiensis]|uniref:SRPBCC family protein n=1 Tax=Bacillus thuringiensis TaxID=1428 RepID=UPI0011A07854|nr:SRPBCC family protein [Bacillus thuringiensis]